MKTLLKGVVGLVVLVIVVAVGVYTWATFTSSRSLARTFETHEVDFPVPFPLAEGEIEASGLSPEEARSLALERATERGRHLVDSRYFCTECHGQDLSGGVMIDAFPIGTLLGPNLTSGAGGRTAAYTAADWDRIVRHGILPDGRPSVMPSTDFELMTDQELSDIVAYIQSFPPVDNEVPEKRLGPLGRVLVSIGEIRLSADDIASHTAAHEVYPPPAEVTPEFGRHLANVCTGCHGPNFAGGPIAGGDPSWPEASNITPHADGMGDWDYDDFVVLMREGIRPDGTEVLEPMSTGIQYLRRMSEVELRAMWTFLRSVPPAETGAR